MPGEAPRRIEDCDTASMIVLSVAESVSLPGFLVEITLPSGSLHNYVRWQLNEKTVIDWDTNGRAQCTTPRDIPSFQGKAMSRAETMAYALILRAGIWKEQKRFLQAAEDYRIAMAGRPDHPVAYNLFAWLIATKEFAGRSKYTPEALEAANRAVALQRIPDYLDTLACAYAATGDFTQAARYEKEALEGAPSKEEFSVRLEQFRSDNPKDCTGAN
jgi:tetratricopeptide (TPR) repeat protein